MKRNKPSPQGVEPLDESGRRLGSLLGALGAGWFVLVFCYPARAFPLQSLMLLGVPAVGCLAVILYSFRQGGLWLLGWRTGLPVMAMILWTLWALVRWQTFSLSVPGSATEFVRISFPGRHGVNTALWMPVLMVLGIMAGRVGNAYWMMFFRCMLVAAVGFSVYGLLQYFIFYEARRRELEMTAGGASWNPLMLQSLLHAFEEKRVGGRLGNGNVFAAQLVTFLALAGPVWASSCLKGREAYGRIGVGVCMLVVVAVILLTRSRGGLITLVAAVMGGVLLVLGNFGAVFRRRNFVLAVGLSGLLLLIAGFLLRERLGNIATIRERIYYWDVAAKVWSRHPVLGSGPGSYELLYPSLKPPKARESKFAHSWLFHTGAETGGVGVLLWVIFAVGVMLPGLRQMAGRAEIAGGGKGATDPRAWLSLACAVLLLNGIFEYSLQVREFCLLLAFLGGGVVGLSPHDRQELVETASNRGLGRFAPMVFKVGVLVLMGVGAYHTTREHMGEFWSWEAGIQADDRQFAEAAAYYEKALGWTPDNALLFPRIASARWRHLERHDPVPTHAPEWRKRIEESLALIARGEALNPLSASLKSDAVIYLDMLDDERAMRKLDEVVALYPNDAGYRLMRGNFAYELGNRSLAQQDYDFIVENKLPIWEFLRPEFESLGGVLARSKPNSDPTPN